MIKANPIDVSCIAYDMIQAFNEWLEQSSKVGYRFSEEEQHYLEQMILIMNNQIDLLVEYESKRKEQKGE